MPALRLRSGQAPAGIQGEQAAAAGYSAWIPAFAGMTQHSSTPQNYHDRLLEMDRGRVGEIALHGLAVLTFPLQVLFLTAQLLAPTEISTDPAPPPVTTLSSITPSPDLSSSLTKIAVPAARVKRMRLLTI